MLIGGLTEGYDAGFVTLSSVDYEFSRGAQSIDEITTRRQFIRSLVSRLMPVGGLLENPRNDAFSVAMSLVVGRKDSQYTDYLLAVALHAYKNGITSQYVLSADIKAFPSALFTIEGVVTLSRKNGSVGHLHLIKLDEVKYSGILAKIKKDL